MIEPQDEAAAFFMERKGYPDARPRDVTKLEGHSCWYYVYELPDGILEIEVEWTGQEWATQVTTFSST